MKTLVCCTLKLSKWKNLFKSGEVREVVFFNHNLILRVFLPLNL